MKSTHYDKHSATHRLYSALTVMLGKRPHATEPMREEAMSELEEFHAWLAQTDASHGLTSEPASHFRARQEAGVTAMLDGNTVVLRVRRSGPKRDPK